MVNIDKWIQKATDWANLNSDDDDCIYIAINRYKALRELSDDKKEEIYDIIACGLGFME